MTEGTVQGRTAIVTGASKGIGYAVAERLAKEGANVVICSRTADAIEAAADRIAEGASGTVVGQRCDMTSPEEVRGLVDSTVDRFGGLAEVAVDGAPLAVRLSTGRPSPS